MRQAATRQAGNVYQKLFGRHLTVFTELHLYLIPAWGNAVPPCLILAGGMPFPW